MKACRGIDSEIWVVDNNSVDGSVEMVQNKFPSARIIANKDNKGFSKANNQAIIRSEGEYVLLLNPDTVVEENTFSSIIAFMDEHPEAGGLGVRMIDGSGKFLPESKRGLPTYDVAFYKISGLSSLFPKSKIFGRYHLGFLDEHEIHTVDVLAGAFMLLRKAVIEKTGNLDEDFFMYGEDIDLSYRITKAGFKNYYFPETTIIHYKGESTKRSSVNYVFVFYNAMIIFAKKHFSKSNASLFSFFIRLAIYLRAAAAIITRFVKRILLPALDFILLFAGMYFLKEYWGNNFMISYPTMFMNAVVPGYCVVWILTVYFSGGYDSPLKVSRVVRGIFTATMIILVIYALLPEALRFSRALILLGAAWASIAMVSLRLIINIIRHRSLSVEGINRKRLIIVGNDEEASRILSLLKLSDTTHNFIGFVSPGNESTRNIPEYQKYYLGKAENLKELAEVYSVDEIIFCGKDVTSQQIINYMSQIHSRDTEFKIAPPESLFIIGSSTVENPGELYVIDINSISKSVNRRNKRFIDLLFSFLFFITSPLLIFLQKKTRGFYANLLDVLTGKLSWVGYAKTDSRLQQLPPIKSGVLSPLDTLQEQIRPDELMVNRLNSLYAKDYRVYTDLNILWKGWRNLGRRPV
jgi:O-antigen biosynthesis protein